MFININGKFYTTNKENDMRDMINFAELEDYTCGALYEMEEIDDSGMSSIALLRSAWYGDDEIDGEQFNPMRSWCVIDDLNHAHSCDDLECAISWLGLEVVEINDTTAARDCAIEYQAWALEEDMTWSECAEFGSFFEELAQKFPELADEFKENAII